MGLPADRRESSAAGRREWRRLSDMWCFDELEMQQGVQILEQGEPGAERGRLDHESVSSTSPSRDSALSKIAPPYAIITTFLPARWRRLSSLYFSRV